MKHAQKVEYKLSVGTANPSPTRTVQGPEVLYKPSSMRFVFGAGPSIRFDDIADFKVSDDKKNLLVVNDSQGRATAVVGALFKVGEFRLKEVHPIDVLVSFEFAVQTDRVLDGFMFGATIGLNKYLSIGAGYALRLGGS